MNHSTVIRSGSIYSDSARKRILGAQDWDDLHTEDRQYLIAFLQDEGNRPYPDSLCKLFELLSTHLLKQEER